VEDPSKLPSEPFKREMWVKGKLPDGAGGEFLVRGIVDRLDKVQITKSDTGEPEVVLCITDYKSGKAPLLKYNQATNDRIV
jgi:ATP-dependent helicase/DNAse subunit B